MKSYLTQGNLTLAGGFCNTSYCHRIGFTLRTGIFKTAFNIITIPFCQLWHIHYSLFWSRGQCVEIFNYKNSKGGQKLTQEELRDILKNRTQREKQVYIAKVTGIDKDVLSKFKLGKINLYPALFSKLENYLTNS